MKRRCAQAGWTGRHRGYQKKTIMFGWLLPIILYCAIRSNTMFVTKTLLSRNVKCIIR